MSVHAGDKPYKCHVCDKAFSHSGTLNDHMTLHTGDKFKCSLCNDSFLQQSSLYQHKRNVHSNRKPYHCPYCGKLFKTNSELKCHVRIHTGAKPYSCRHCSERFTWPYRLKAHLLKSHNEGTWLTCHICQKKFTHHGDLKIHVRRHEGVKPYVCSECPKCFCTAGALKDHQLTHSDYKQFCCGLCGINVKRKDTVKSHFKRCSDKLGFKNVFAIVTKEINKTSGHLPTVGC